MTSPDGLVVERPSPGIVRLILDRPPSNALNDALRARLAAAIDAIDADHSVRAVILTGQGRAFCAGDDLKEALPALGSPGRAAALERLKDWSALFDTVEACRAPVIAAINGWAMGGGLELALCCDVRLASSEASFACAGVRIGLIASAWRLPRLIGVSRAKALLLGGETFDAGTAERCGLVSGIHAPDALAAEALALAERIAARAPLSVEATKRVVDASSGLDAHAAGALQDAAILELAMSEDHAEALEAFMARRDPQFRRR